MMTRAHLLPAPPQTQAQTRAAASALGLLVWFAGVALAERELRWQPGTLAHQYAWWLLVVAGLLAGGAFAAERKFWLPLAGLSFATLAVILPPGRWLSQTGAISAAAWLTGISSLAVACIHGRSTWRDGVAARDGAEQLAAPVTFLLSFLIAAVVGALTFGIGSTLLALHDRRQRDGEAVPEQADDASSPPPLRSLAELLAELDGLVGLAPVKAQVRDLVDFIQVQQERARRGLPTEPITLHLAFKGNSGTGKTKVARLVAQIYCALGLLPTARVVEKQAGDLTAGYVRQTAAKVNAACDEALGGVLFLDEIDALIPKGDNDFAREANKALLARTENDRAQLALIIAGYTDAVDAYLATDPGWDSRVPRRIIFPDYSPAELVEITKREFCAAEHYILDTSAEAALEAEFARRGPHSGNARLARNFFDAAKVAQPPRLRATGKALRQLSEAELSTLTGDDIRVAIARVG
jgi:hypothetical protein